MRGLRQGRTCEGSLLGGSMRITNAYPLVFSHSVARTKERWADVYESLTSFLWSIGYLAIELPTAIAVTLYSIVVTPAAPIAVWNINRKNKRKERRLIHTSRDIGQNEALEMYALDWMLIYPEEPMYRRVYALARGLEPVVDLPDHWHYYRIASDDPIHVHGYAHWADENGFDMTKLVTDTGVRPDWATHIVTHR